jgi:hypothetical protein
VDRDIVNLVVLALHQQSLAIPADKIDRVIACVEHRWDLEYATDEWRGDEFETETRMWAHAVLPSVQAGALPRLSVNRRLAQGRYR